jgi:hypothetical protein
MVGNGDPVTGSNSSGSLHARSRQALSRARACVDERNAYVAAHGHDDVSRAFLSRLELLMLIVDQAHIDYGAAIGDEKMVEAARASLEKGHRQIFMLHEIDRMTGKAGRGH